LGSPAQLTKQQVEAIKTINNGKPETSKVIKIAGNNPFDMELPLRENDVYLIELKRLFN
jgi:xylan 1,4-beta-xylosidase